ncbi:unnamed protein product [Darwinula stevensoni]|uniref:Uncharacterized protein n=1 Tax=Darwinula stevensoni TaxID=69355 RepID=A0A7R9A8S0_9CRUS|nr:unnamed protein product [Darwinula stevensoni]CAG0896708.1 unnamed protein product [Darwinula stevensoni]
MVFYTCGAGDGTSSDCGIDTDVATKIECCQVEEGTLTSDTCKEKTGDAGTTLDCDYNQFLQGVCGSVSGTSCTGSSHSIGCCNYYFKDTCSTTDHKLYQVERMIEDSPNGFESQ